MADEPRSNSFYGSIPIFRSFGSVMDPVHYMPLPDDWLIGTADIVSSTAAIAAKKYKAVNMAGAAVIASVTNALENREFPFVFGGDGASFAVSAQDSDAARSALAATATWVREDLGLTMRVALVPVSAIRAAGRDVRVGRYAASPDVSYAMFAGGGMSWAEAAMKRGEFAVMPAAPGMLPDLSGLSCRFAEILSARGVILALVVLPAPDADPERFQKLVEDIVAQVEQSPQSARPVPPAGPPVGWPPPGAELEARALASNGSSLFRRRAGVFAFTLFSFVIMRFGIKVGGFVPEIYLGQVVANSDFRKYDDALRMVLDCTPELAAEIERRLSKAAADGVAQFGAHRQDAAMMTCFTPSAMRSDHVHFIDGARGGYASAAASLKAKLAAVAEPVSAVASTA